MSFSASSLGCAGVARARRLWPAVFLIALLAAVALPALWPASVSANHNAPCNQRGWKQQCNCKYHYRQIIDEQLRAVSPDPTNLVGSRLELRATQFGQNLASMMPLVSFQGEHRLRWWRVESGKEVCARLDLAASARGATRVLAAGLTGLVGISFVWSVVQMMQESVTAGNPGQARNNMMRALVGLIIFGTVWVIYESVMVSFFGVQEFTAGSFVGLAGVN